MCGPLARSDYYAASAPSRVLNRGRVYPTRPSGARPAGTARDGSRVRCEPIDQLGIQLCPAASPRLRRRPSPWPPHQHAKPATESAIRLGWPCTASRPNPPDLSRRHAYGALTLVPLVYRLIPLAGPGPSGSTRPSRLCQRCFPPSPASPRSGCAQLLPGCCDSPARRNPTSFGSQRLTAYQRLVARHR